MLLPVTILLTFGGALGLVIGDVAGPFQSGGTVPLTWESNANTDPSVFDLEINSPTLNSTNVIAKNVSIISNQITAQLPTLPPSDDYIFWFVDPAKPEFFVFGNSNSFTVTDKTTSSPTTSTAANEAPPISPLSSSSNTGTQPPQTQAAGSAIQATSKSISSGAIAGIAVGTVVVLILAAILWLFLRRSRRRERLLELEPEVYPPMPHDEEHGIREVEILPREKSRPLAPQRRPAVEQLREMEAQLAANTHAMGQRDGDLEEALQENEALRVRIRALERDLQSQTDSYEPPPRYLD
ncbi:hypothetical protein B0H19DRAFT_1191725 [Mycena capillaripes]|nr:hypothetical protein B0H19DRAFT_1191725 [Mycena capillaripes]